MLKLRALAVKALVVRLTRALESDKSLPCVWRLLYPAIFRGPYAELEQFIAGFDITLLYRIFHETGEKDVTSSNLKKIRSTLFQYVFEEAYLKCPAIESTAPCSIQF